MNNKDKNKGYLDLIKEILKNDNTDNDKYEPKNYDFNLDIFDEDGNIKK